MVKKITIFTFLVVLLSCTQGSCVRQGADVRHDLDDHRGADDRNPDIENYWNDKDFADSVYVNDGDGMEQDFVNYVLRLSYHSDSTVVARSITEMLNSASTTPATLIRLNALARHYLAHPNSPMRNETLWIAYLDVVRNMDSTAPGLKEKYDWEHDMALKNRVGTIAADFEYEVVDTVQSGGYVVQSSRCTLHTTHLQPYTSLLVVFYDPECPTCETILDALNENNDFQRAIHDNLIKVLAVAVEADRNDWLNAPHKLPSNWIVAYNTDSIVDREVYMLPALPSFYLLDSSYRVIGKDIDIETLLDFTMHNALLTIHNAQGCRDARFVRPSCMARNRDNF